MSNSSVKAALGAALIAFPALLAAPAEAHIVLETTSAPADSYFQVTFLAPHGCEGSATTGLTITLPEGTLVAKPQPKPGWQLEITKKPLPEPVEGPHGALFEEAVETITWRHGKLPDAQFDAFKIHMRLPAVDQETKLYFPVLQTCEQGTRNWNEIAEEGGAPPASPAPALTLMPAQNAHHAH
jgi:uncharacterized protein YcnI